jgi:hypothetical protein
LHSHSHSHSHSSRAARGARRATARRRAFVSCAFPDDGRPPYCTLDAIDPVRGTRTTLLDDLGIVFAGELSPDERSFLFTPLDPRTGAPTGLFVRSVDGGAARRLVDGYGGRWSPDGERIAFVSDRDRNGRCLFHDCLGHAGELYVADADGGNERRLTENPEVDGVPTWSGDASGSCSAGSRTRRPTGISTRSAPTASASCS